MSDLQKHTLAIVNALFGSVLFGSDDFGKYDEKKRRIFSSLCRLQKAEVLGVEVTVGGKTITVLVDYRDGGEKKQMTLTI
jgi:hypothetical protein